MAVWFSDAGANGDSIAPSTIPTLTCVLTVQEQVSIQGLLWIKKASGWTWMHKDQIYCQHTEQNWGLWHNSYWRISLKFAIYNPNRYTIRKYIQVNAAIIRGISSPRSRIQSSNPKMQQKRLTCVISSINRCSIQQFPNPLPSKIQLSLKPSPKLPNSGP